MIANVCGVMTRAVTGALTLWAVVLAVVCDSAIGGHPDKPGERDGTR